MTDKQITAYLQSEEGKMNAERFIKALKERRILCTVKNVSRSGMSRIISFCEVVRLNSGYAIYQFNWFFKNLGYEYRNDWDAIRVGGCGMDMILATLSGVCGTLKYNGFKLPKNYSSLAESYLRI